MSKRWNQAVNLGDSRPAGEPRNLAAYIVSRYYWMVKRKKVARRWNRGGADVYHAISPNERGQRIIAAPISEEKIMTFVIYYAPYSKFVS